MYLVAGRRFPKESLLFNSRVFYETSPRRCERDNLKSANRVSVLSTGSIDVNFYQISFLCAVLKFTGLPPLGSLLSRSYKNASTTHLAPFSLAQAFRPVPQRVNFLWGGQESPPIKSLLKMVQDVRSTTQSRK